MNSSTFKPPLPGQGLTHKPGATRLLWSAIFAILAVLVLVTLLFAPIPLSLDGYSHLHHSAILRQMSLDGVGHKDLYDINSPLLPNWLTSVLLAILSIILPPEWALRAVMAILAVSLFAALLFCAEVAKSAPSGRSRVLIVLLPFCIGSFLTLGFIGFLASASIALFVLGILLRHGTNLPPGLQASVFLLLIAAYYFHPLPVLLSFAMVCSLLVGALIENRQVVKPHHPPRRKYLSMTWPWYVPLCCSLYFQTTLQDYSRSSSHDFVSTAKTRILELLNNGVSEISPTGHGVTYTVLIALLLPAVIAGSNSFTGRSNKGAIGLLLFCLLMFFASIAAPSGFGSGGYIPDRLLFFAVVTMSLISIRTRMLRGRVLNVAAAVASIVVVEFCLQYWVSAARVKPAFDEVKAAFSMLPLNSSVVFLGYRLSPSCSRRPLLHRTMPEKHWALAGALMGNHIILNDYQALSSVFPLKMEFSPVASIRDEIRLHDEENVKAWTRFIERSWPEVDFIVSWGVPSGTSICRERINQPLADQLHQHYDLAHFADGSSRVSVWKRRAVGVVP